MAVLLLLLIVVEEVVKVVSVVMIVVANVSLESKIYLNSVVVNKSTKLPFFTS